MLRKRCHPPASGECSFFSSVEITPSPPPRKRTRQSKAVVRFADKSQYFEPVFRLDDSDDTGLKSLVWFSKPDLKAMEAEASYDARQLKTEEKYTPATAFSWSRSLYRVFRALQQQQRQLVENSYGTVDDNDPRQQQIILNHQHTVVLTARVMGLEGVIISPIARDFMARRKRILAYLQQEKEVRRRHKDMTMLPPTSESVKDRDWEENLAETVRRESCVARLYAQVLAQASLNANEDC